MAQKKKSKTQRAKASAERQQKKAAAAQDAESSERAEEKKDVETKAAEAKAAKKEEAKRPRRQRFAFLKDVRGELRRVTWPTRKDVLQWTGVVVAALLFFGAYVALLDNAVMTPALVWISGLTPPAA